MKRIVFPVAGTLIILAIAGILVNAQTQSKEAVYTFLPPIQFHVPSQFQYSHYEHTITACLVEEGGVSSWGQPQVVERKVSREEVRDGMAEDDEVYQSVRSYYSKLKEVGHISTFYWPRLIGDMNPPIGDLKIRVASHKIVFRSTPRQADVYLSR